MSEDKVKQTTNNPVILEMEEKYPEMTREFKKIMRDQYETFCKKMLDYGKGNILLGGEIENEEDRKLALKGITIRINDKSNRLINLLLKDKKIINYESSIDNFQDITNYCIIAQIINNQKWK